RGSMGALLRLPVHQLSWAALMELTDELAVWTATVDGERPYTAVDWTQPAALIIGSEAHGAGHAARRLADGSITIPMHTATESLNAAMAAGIILFEAKRRRNLHQD
ncbi:MAG: RNA methyltransferase, partial [Anaerolineales bacterium]|nr:RNA methyltransferase [Anaerolineales bacterium]